jgi:hypothetical protein
MYFQIPYILINLFLDAKIYIEKEKYPLDALIGQRELQQRDGF